MRIRAVVSEVLGYPIIVIEPYGVGEVDKWADRSRDNIVLQKVADLVNNALDVYEEE